MNSPTMQRHWRLAQALWAHRIERRLGRYLTDDELRRWAGRIDILQLRQLDARYTPARHRERMRERLAERKAAA